jgi:hypothetical protein
MNIVINLKIIIHSNSHITINININLTIHRNVNLNVKGYGFWLGGSAR